MKRPKKSDKDSSVSLRDNDQSSSLIRLNERRLSAFHSEKNLKDQSGPRFQRINFDSPEASVSANLDASEHRDLFSKSGFDTPFVSPKEKTMEKDLSLFMEKYEQEMGSGELSDLRKSQGSNGPKIYVTAVEGLNKAETTKMPVCSFNSLPTLKERMSVRDKIKQLLGIKERKLTIHLVGDQIKKKQQMFSEKHSGGTKVINAGRLLQIIADQALYGRNSEVSKAFKTALLRINKGALDKAQLIAQRKKRRSRNILQGIKKFFQNLVGPWRPDSGFIAVWNVLVLATILLQAFLSPLILVFLQDSSSVDSAILMMHLIVDAIYLFSIVIHFRTAFYHHGELRSQHKDILFNYLRSGLIMDFISMFAIIGREASSSSDLKYLGLLALLRLYRIPTLIASIEDYFQFNRKVKTMVEIAKLTFVVFILAHWFGCILYSITKIEQNTLNWLNTVQGVDDGDVVGYYVASLYWAIMTMSTVGYGDIAPVTTNERVLTIGIMIISSIVFGFLLSAIGGLLLEFSRFSSESREKIRLLNKYMHEKGLNKDIQSKIRKYLEFYLDKENAIRAEGDSIIQLLSQSLKDEIIKEVNAKILNDIYMFSFNFRKKFLYLIAKDFTEKSFGPDEVIFQHNDQNDCSVYFIISGKVEIYYDKSDLSLQKIDKGKSFGFLSFFSGQPRTASARSLEFTTVFILNREKFLSKLEEFHTEKEMYTMIKDSINLYSSYQYLNIKCYSCGSRDHIAINCQKVHFKFDHQKVIYKYLYLQKKFRERFQRRPRRRFQPLQEFEAVQEGAAQHQLIQQNELYFDKDERTEVEQTEVRSYSSIDDVMDRNIYDLQPLVCANESIQLRIFNFNDPEDILENSVNSSIYVRPQKKGRHHHRKKTHIGKNREVEIFVATNYDKYYHNISLDRVKNFEVYNPNNNIIKLMVDFERVRLQKIVEMRLGAGAHHLSKILIKGFRMHERLQNKNVSASSVSSARSLDTEKRSVPVVDLRKFSVDPLRRHSVAVNPSDITMYGTISRHMDNSKHDSSPDKSSDRSSPLPNFKSAGGLYSLLKVPNAGKNDKTSNQRNLKKSGISSIHEENTLEDQLASSARKKRSRTQLQQPSSISSRSSESEQTSQVSRSSIIDSGRSPFTRNHLQKAIMEKEHTKKLTAQFGSKRSDSSQTHQQRPSISLMVKPRASVPVNLFQPSKDRKAVIYTETAIDNSENEAREQKKPIAMFDFTQLVKKMTLKLEENSTKSPLNRTASGISNHTSFPSNLGKMSPQKKSLFVEILHRSNSRFVRKKKTRSSSQGNGEFVTNLIEKYRLDEIG